MDKLDEKLHVPDSDNVDILIQNVFDDIEKDIMTELHQRTPVSGLPLNNRTAGLIRLTSDINPCKWLADDCAVVYKVYFDNDMHQKKASFFNNTGRGYIEHGIDELAISPRIHMAILLVEFSISDDVYNNIGDPVKPKVSDVLLDVKSMLRHELSHAYKELFVPDKFQYKDTRYRGVDMQKFSNAYDLVVDRLSELRGEICDEKNFLFLLYSCCFKETDAHISGFYQSLLNDATVHGGVDTLDSYPDYINYNNNVKFVSVFNDPDIFRKYKPVISALFGSSASEYPNFRRRMIAINKDVIDKMKCLYGFVKTNQRDYSETKNITLEESIFVYERDLAEYTKKLYEGVHSDDNIIIDVLSHHYVMTDQNSLLQRVRAFFGKELSPRYF